MPAPLADRQDAPKAPGGPTSDCPRTRGGAPQGRLEQVEAGGRRLRLAQLLADRGNGRAPQDLLQLRRAFEKAPAGRDDQRRLGEKQSADVDEGVGTPR